MHQEFQRFPGLKKFIAVIVVALVGGVFIARESQSADACKAELKTMLEQCVPVCAKEDPDGNGTDECIKACAWKEFDRAIPQC